MPGIHGFWFPQSNEDFKNNKLRLTKSARWQKHDYQQEIEFPEWGLFLQVNGLTGLPLTRLNINEQIFALMYGELYPTKNTSQQILLKQLVENFLKFGIKSLETVDGTFLIAIVQRTPQKLYLINDHFASLPLNYFWQKGKFVFSSLFKPLLALNPRIEFDTKSFFEFLTIGFPLNGRTILKNVQRLWPGSVITVSPEAIQVQTYFEPRFKVINRSRKNLKNQILERFERAIIIRKPEDENLISALSGGLDSRTIWAYLLHKQIPAKAYTHGLSSSTDFQIAQNIVNYFQIPALRFPLDEFPFAPAIEQLINLAEGYMQPENAFLISFYRGLTQPIVVFDGAGGQLYRRQLKRSYFSLVHDRQPFTQFLFNRSVSDSFFRTFLDTQIWPTIRKNILQEIESYVHRFRDYGTNEDLLDLFHLHLSAGLKFSVDLLLQSYFVKVRQPFYDRELFELARQTSTSLRKKLIFQRTIIKQLCPQLTRFPLETRGVSVPYFGFRFLRAFPLLFRQLGVALPPFFLSHPLLNIEDITQRLTSNLLPKAIAELTQQNFLPFKSATLQSVVNQPQNFSANQILTLVNLGNMLKILNDARK